MYYDLHEVAVNLGNLLDEIESETMKALPAMAGVQARRAQSVLERVRIAKGKVAEELYTLLRDLQMLEGVRV